MDISKSNLYTLFCTLSQAELKDLDKALQSPYFNYRNQEVRLFNYLLKAKKANHTVIDGNDAYKYVFEDKKTDLAKLRHVMTYLSRIINRVLIIQETENEEEQQKLLLAAILRKRNLGKQFIQAYTDANTYYDTVAPLSPALYYNQLQLHTEYYTYSITNRRAQTDELQRLGDDLDTFYAIQKLKQACNLLSYKNVFKSSHQPEPIDETLALIERKKLFDNPLVSLLYYNYLCLSSPDNETYFDQLKDALLNKSNRVDTKELRDIFTLAINYCIKRLNTGGQKYYRHVFEIYAAGLARAVFEDSGRLSPFTYKNISAIAIGLKEYEWVAAFLEAYKNKLSEDIRDGFYAYCMARYYFAIANFNKVSELLQEVEIKEQFTELDARVLLIKTYYELDEDGLLDYTIGNLKQQLKRKKLQTYHGEVYKNFAKMVSKLTHLRPYDKKARDAYKQQLAATKAIAERDWLTAKIK